MARELGPKGLRVAHVVIDGAIDTDFIRENFPERYALSEKDGILNPGHIAEIAAETGAQVGYRPLLDRLEFVKEALQ